jgi:hypothetical protein
VIRFNSSNGVRKQDKDKVEKGAVIREDLPEDMTPK